MHEPIGQNWLLLRGLSRESAHWGDFRATLQTRFPSANIAALDLPGAGEYCRQTSPSDISEITDQVRRQAGQRGLLKRPLTLLGLSLGGMVAWEWAVKYPDEIRAVALINSSFASLSPFYRRMRWQNYPRLLTILLHRQPTRRERAILRWVTNRRDLDDATASAWADIQRQRPVTLTTTLKQLAAAARYRPAAARPTQPVLLLNSQGDRLVDPLCSQAIGQHWNLPINTHPWAGHDLSLDDGEWVADRLRDWAR